MELWIRSQDKERLMKINGLNYVGYNDNHIINGYGTNECDNYDLGIYKTKERALEVLDEIHSCIQTNELFDLYSKLGKFPNEFNIKYNLVSVYQMPKE